MTDKWKVFLGADDQWYFRRVAPNGEIVAQSEGYIEKVSAVSEATRQADGVAPEVKE